MGRKWHETTRPAAITITVDDAGIPQTTVVQKPTGQTLALHGAVLTACEQRHIAVVADWPAKADAPLCWAPSCRTPLRRVSRATANRLREQSRLTAGLRSAS